MKAIVIALALAATPAGERPATPAEVRPKPKRSPEEAAPPKRDADAMLAEKAPEPPPAPTPLPEPDFIAWEPTAEQARHWAPTSIDAAFAA